MYQLLKNRRSIRKYKKTKVEDEKIRSLLKAALLAPSSRARRPWVLIAVDDDKQIQTLSKTKEQGSSFLKGAPLALVVAADPSKSDVWVEDCSIVSTIIQLEAEALGLKSCWIQVRNRQHSPQMSSASFVKNQLDLPDTYEVLSILAIGYPDEEKEACDESLFFKEKVHYNKFSL